MFDHLSIRQLISLVCALYLVFLGITASTSGMPQNPRAGFAAAATPDMNTRTTTGTGALIPPYSYCAHWFARSGKACVSTAVAGDLVVVDTGIPTGSMDDIAIAAAHCARAGCKVALYCECETTAHVQRVKDIFSSFATRFPGVMYPAVEVDGIRDIPGKDIDVVRALGTHGLSLILKNYNAIERYSQYTPVARVIYEDIGRTGSYLDEFKQLAASRPSLLISGILHQGSYASDLGGTNYPGTSMAEAQQIFTSLAQFKNVELFYGTPTGFQKIKSFDGGISGIAREEGVISSRYTPPGFTGNTGISTVGLAQSMQGFSNAPIASQPIQQPFSPANIQLAGFSQPTPAPAATNPISQSATPPANSIEKIANGSLPDPTKVTPSQPAPIPLNDNTVSGNALPVPANVDATTDASPTPQIIAPQTFPTTPANDPNTDSIVSSIANAVLELLKSVTSFFSGPR